LLEQKQKRNEEEVEPNKDGKGMMKTYWGVENIFREF
jgi:hypothetical protein